MQILLIFLISLMWSVVGILVKASSFSVSSTIITFSRFFFGVLFLGLILLVRDKRVCLYIRSKWLWIGVMGKCLNYTLENLGISMGHAYGNVLVMPSETLFLIVLSGLYLKEKISSKGWAGIILCILGTFLVSWNGLPVSLFFGKDALIAVLFILSGIGAGFHLFSQKILVESMDNAKMNFSVFLLSSALISFLVPFDFRMSGRFNPIILLFLICLGLITGLSFFLYSSVVKKVPLIIVVVISNSSVLFSLLWANIFFDETITHYIIWGVLLFTAGVILINLQGKNRQKETCPVQLEHKASI